MHKYKLVVGQKFIVKSEMYLETEGKGLTFSVGNVFKIVELGDPIKFEVEKFGQPPIVISDAKLNELIEHGSLVELHCRDYSEKKTYAVSKPPCCISDETLKTLRSDFKRSGKDHIDLINGLSTMCVGDGVQVDWIHPICWNHDREHFVYIMSTYYPYTPIDCFVVIDHVDDKWVSEIKTMNELDPSDFGIS